MLNAMFDFVFPPSLMLGLMTAIGLAFGSFGNVLIFRLPEHESITGRSHCPACHRTLAVWELFPVISFLVLRGKCSGCGKKISWQYPLIELATCLLFIFAIIQSNFFFWHALAFAFSLWLLLLIAIIDARTSLIPDILSVPFIILAIITQLAGHTFDATGMILGASFFGIQWLISRGAWVGSGDILLGLGIGALLGGWREVSIFLFFSYIIGACFALWVLSSKRKGINDAVPFGPFLVMGTFLTVVFGSALRVYLVF